MNPTSSAPPWRLRRLLRAQARLLVPGGFAMAARAMVLILLPWPLKFIIDSVLLDKPLPSALALWLPDPGRDPLALLTALALTMLALGVADAALAYFGNRAFLDAGQRVVFALRRELFGHLLRLPPSFHRGRRAGELMSRLSGDVNRLQDFLAAVGTGIIPHFLTIAGMLAVMVALDWRYALVALAITPVLALISERWTGKLRRALRAVRASDGALWGMAQETLGAVPLVQSCGRESHEEARFAAQAQTSLAASLLANRAQAQFTPLVNLVIALGSGAITWYGAMRVLRGDLTAGDLLVFLAYLRGLVTPARQLAKAGPVYGRTMVALERIREIFATQPAIADKPGVLPPETSTGRIEFRGVYFGHLAGSSVLEDISFTIEPGRLVALVGPTGAGKSTIAALAARFADPVGGAILLDGRDLRDLPLAYVRRRVAVMAQESMLLAAPVWENIAYGRIGADRAAAIRAARRAGVEEIIAALPHGFDHELAERGASISGGQRQAIAMARAVLADAPVVILDEPSASLDAFSEVQMMAALRRVTAARAALVIAHRLATIERADTILVLERGRIVQAGTHRSLLAEGGLYASLWRSQNRSAGFATEGRLGGPVPAA